jgi:hypothetical protein
MVSNRELKTTGRNWLYKDFPTTHVATVSVEAPYMSDDAVKSVARRFLYKFNEKVWTSNVWKSVNNQNRIGVVPVIHNQKHMDKAHIHFAFCGFPKRLSEDQLHKLFHSTAQHTRGVQYRWNDANKLDGRLKTEFNKVGSSEAWLNYITRKMVGIDDNILIELMHIPSATLTQYSLQV